MDLQKLSCIKTALMIIPKYDGNPNQLHRFIETSETILTQFYDRTTPDCFNNSIILHNILNKLEGKAEEIVNINGVSSWDHIKTVLLKNFGDQRDENSLNRDLVNMKQENESAHEYYNRCMNILNTIINYVNLHETVEAVKDCKRSFFQAQTLKTFLAGLKEPFGTTIRAMRPVDLPTALNFIKEEENIRYVQKSNNFSMVNNNKLFQNNNNNSRNLPFPNLNKPLQPHQNFKFNNSQPFKPFTPYFNRNNNNNFVTSKPYFNRPNFNNNSWNRPQNPYRALQQNFNNSNTNNKPNTQSKPVPMSGISYNSANIPLRPSVPNYHSTQYPETAMCNQFEELHMLETNPNNSHVEHSCDVPCTDKDDPCARNSYENNNEYNELDYDDIQYWPTQNDPNFHQGSSAKPET